MEGLLTLLLILFVGYHLIHFVWLVGYIVTDIVKAIREMYKRGDFDDW